MANKKLKVVALIFATLATFFVASLIGYFVAVQYAVSSSKYEGKPLDYLPEKITKLETEFKSKTGIYFRSEGGKLYVCNNAEKSCEEREDEPPRYEEKTPFVETQGTYAKFKLPPSKPKQIVFRRGRGLVGHQTATQYALLNEGKVWYWHYSGNEMGDSFPFWHLHNLTPLLIGTILGLIFGVIVSAVGWFLLYPRK